MYELVLSVGIHGVALAILFIGIVLAMVGGRPRKENLGRVFEDLMYVRGLRRGPRR